MSVQDKFGTAIILAGGKSTRMGFDKQFLSLDNCRVIDSLIDELKKEFTDIIIVTNKPEEYKSDEYECCTIVSDIIKEMGPLSGLHVGLLSARFQYSFFIACDMPNINLDFVRYMKTRVLKSLPDACVVETREHVQAFNSFYSRDIVKKIENHLSEDRRSLNSLLSSLDTLYLKEEEVMNFDLDKLFMNLNTQAEVEKYKKEK